RSASRSAGRRQPRKLWTAGRGRSAGSSRTGGAPASAAREGGSGGGGGPRGGPPRRPAGEAPCSVGGPGGGGRGAPAGGGAGAGRVEVRELLEEDGERPAVGDDVVDGQERHRPAGGERHDGGAEERPADEVERPPHLLDEEAVGLAAAGRRGERGDVDLGQRH